jgi:hypothetical protein
VNCVTTGLITQHVTVISIQKFPSQGEPYDNRQVHFTSANEAKSELLVVRSRTQASYLIGCNLFNLFQM